jgi:phosphoribosylamine---glycine ligase
VTAGGRVLAVTAVAAIVGRGAGQELQTPNGVQFAGRQLRRDIGWRELARAR